MYRSFLKVVVVGFIVLALPVRAQRTTYFKFIIDGTESDTMTQGQDMAWKCDCGLGDTLWGELWLDLDGDHSIDTLVDKPWQMMFPFRFVDGDTNWEQGPADSSGIPDGIFYCDLSQMFRSMGFAPTNYIMRVINWNDGSTAQDWLRIDPLPSPPATVSGRVSIEGITPPDPLLNAIWISTDMEQGPWWSAITDNMGDYTLNLPVSGSTWFLGPIDNILSYIRPPFTELVVSGDVTGVDFLYEEPEAIVYGKVRDDRDSLLPFEVGVGYWNETTGENGGQNTTNGNFLFGMHAGEIWLGVDEDILIPDYLAPRKHFTLNVGDSLEKNLTCYRTNASIYGVVTENDSPPSQSYAFEAWNDIFGNTETYSNPSTGWFELRVYSEAKQNYWVQLNVWETPLPEGFGFESGNGWDVCPGETVYVKLVSYKGSVSGSLSVESGDPVPDFEEFTARVFDPMTWETKGQSQVNGDGTYKTYAPEGTWSIELWGPEEWLRLPACIESVTVDTVDVPGNDFLLNYGHCTVSGHLYGLEPIPEWLGVDAGGNGGWPDGYQAWADVEDDGSYSMKICEAEWHMWAPWVDGYEVEPQETTFTVTESEYSIIVDFYYTQIGVEEVKPVAQGFSLAVSPNPFSKTTVISVQGIVVSERQRVNLQIYDLSGRLVKSFPLITDHSPLTTVVSWDRRDNKGKKVSAGIYFVRMQVGDFRSVKKIVVIQ